MHKKNWKKNRNYLVKSRRNRGEFISGVLVPSPPPQTLNKHVLNTFIFDSIHRPLESPLANSQRAVFSKWSLKADGLSLKAVLCKKKKPVPQSHLQPLPKIDFHRMCQRIVQNLGQMKEVVHFFFRKTSLTLSAS